MNFGELQCPPFPEDENNMIISTRIRVGRNLADFPLGPGISRDQRNKVEELVKKACTSFTGELEGTYYALNSMTEDQKNQLINDHFLFK
jgi:arginine kinase